MTYMVSTNIHYNFVINFYSSFAKLLCIQYLSLPHNILYRIYDVYFILLLQLFSLHCRLNSIFMCVAVCIELIFIEHSITYLY